MRAVLERCQHTGPRMHTLVTLGAQHQGIMNVPECWNPSFNATPAKPFCWAAQRLLGWGAYLPWIRSHVIQAQYFKVGMAHRAERVPCMRQHAGPGRFVAAAA